MGIFLLLSIAIHHQIIKNIRQRKNNFNEIIEENIIYMIESLKLYDEDYSEVTRNGKITREKFVSRAIRISYKIDDNKLSIRVYRDGIDLLKYHLQKTFLKL